MGWKDLYLRFRVFIAVFDGIFYCDLNQFKQSIIQLLFSVVLCVKHLVSSQLIQAEISWSLLSLCTPF